MPGAQGGQKRLSNPLNLEVWMVVMCIKGAGSLGHLGEQLLLLTTEPALQRLVILKMLLF